MSKLYTLMIVVIIVSLAWVNAGEIKRMGNDSPALRLYRQKVAKPSPVPRKVVEVEEVKPPRVSVVKQARPAIKIDDRLTVKTLTDRYVAYLEGMTGMKIDTVTIDVKRMLNSDGWFDISCDVAVSDGETVKSH